MGENLYFDGALGDPVPVQKAFDLGCDRVIVLLTKPESQIRTSEKDERMAHVLRHHYPLAANQLRARADKYNAGVALAQRYAAEGKALIVAPEDTCGVSTLTRDREALERLYRRGYDDGVKISGFLKRCGCAQ